MRPALLGRSAVVTAGVTVELAAQFLRTIMLARLLNPTEFGLVISINTLYAMIEMLSFVGTERYLVYSADGSEQHALDVAHTLVFLRGVVTSTLLLLSAQPTSMILGQPDVAGSFGLISVVPLLGGLSHLGLNQMQRLGQFFPSAFCGAASASIGLAVAVGAAAVQADHLATVWGLLAQSGASMIISHLLSRDRAYRFSVDLSRMWDALKFGLPLAVNGAALAVSSQLDRLVVGAWLGVAALGIYGLTATVLLQPMSLLLRVSTTVLQPPISNAWHADRTGRFQWQVRQVTTASSLLGFAAAAATTCLGSPVLRLVFGPRFVVGDAAFALFAAMLLVRPNRFALNMFGLSIGRTADLMISNLAGGVGLLTTVVALFLHPTLESAALGLLVSEASSLVAASVRLRRYIATSDRLLSRTLAAAAVLPAILAAWILLVDPSLYLRGLATLICMVAASLLAWPMLAPVRRRTQFGEVETKS